MPTDRHVTLYHAPNTRSTSVLVLLEELAADYELRLLDFAADEQHGPAYLRVNPMGKVPAIRHGDAIVTEQVAIYLYLADLYADRGLAPPPGDPLRGPYLRWLVFYAACFEPALVDRALKRDPAPGATSPYGTFDTMLGTITAQIDPGPYLLGEKFSAADVLWGTALGLATGWRLVPTTAQIERYVRALNERPAVIRARARDAQLAAART